MAVVVDYCAIRAHGLPGCAAPSRKADVIASDLLQRCGVDAR
jgi:hypothetical protein